MTQRKVFFLGTILTALLFGALLHFSDQQIPSWTYKIQGVIVYTVASLVGGAFFAFVFGQIEKE